MEIGSSGTQGGSMPQTQGATQTPRNCVSCGRLIDWHANVCPYCGYDYRVQVAQAPIVVTTSKPIIAGILILIAGILAIGMGIIYLSIDASDIEDAGYTPISQGEMSLSELEEIMNVCGGLEFVFGTIAAIGGVFAMMRKYFVLALVGGVFALLGFGFVVGSLLGLIGIILIALSRDEFGQAAKPAKNSEYHY
jgi:RNA polymerase subunit RPABC4/transcription elongation factor Spt4